MKKLKIVLAAVLCAVMAVCFVACTPGGSDYEINYDIDLNNKPQLNVLMPYSGKPISEVNADPTAKLIEQLTGYTVNYTQLPAADASTTLNTELMDKRPYNVMKLTKDQFSDLVKDDMLVDITDALSVFAPDMLENISEESWDAVTVDGRIYGVPERASSDNIENPIVFNQDLLLQCNLDVPETLDEFTEVLRVLTQKLGRPALTFDQYTPLVYAVSAAFGIYSDWQEYTVNGKTEVLYYMNAPRYAEYVNYMHELYVAGYIDQEVATIDAADASNRFVNGFTDSEVAKAAAYACSLWSVPAIVTGLQANGVITSTEAAGTLENQLAYLRALKENKTDEEKVYRSSGYGYIIAIPFYEAENAGYALDWMNSKIKDTAEESNFRSIVLGEEGVHWTYSPSQGYLPISDNFSEKDEASYFLTGTNENKYTEYWKARVRKQPELYRAWSTLMDNADAVGVYNVADFTPPIEDYNSHRSAMEEYAQDQFYIMMKEGTSNINEYLTKLNSQQGGTVATQAINQWYSTYNK
ncbi:MAG TPA: extracellular solute-binding protein [Candidatus Fimimonas gallinarum]|uniref:Extracellular solute-binding protein n=1 Tax=Candidatus Fimimonas gallinarum TaxID=2840821 RepID=A0A9D1E3F6_9BACT|nr:extracellular solute-binding protein [Candidatus Fimimonas gallinarum]